jgi:hypothetical protein
VLPVKTIPNWRQRTRGNRISQQEADKERDHSRAASKQGAIGAATPGLPLKRGATLSQQIEIAKLQATWTFEERHTLDNDYTIALMCIQKHIDHHMDLAKLWDAKDRSNPIFSDNRTL